MLAFAAGEHSRLWPAVTDQPTSETVGNSPFEGTAHYQQVLDLWEGIARP